MSWKAFVCHRLPITYCHSLVVCISWSIIFSPYCVINVFHPDVWSVLSNTSSTKDVLVKNQEHLLHWLILGLCRCQQVIPVLILGGSWEACWRWRLPTTWTHHLLVIRFLCGYLVRTPCSLYCGNSSHSNTFLPPIFSTVDIQSTYSFSLGK